MRYRAVFGVSTEEEEQDNDGANVIMWGLLPKMIKFVYETNKRGERTQLWEEPVEDKRTSNKTPFTLTLCNIAAKKSNNQKN